MTALRVAVEIIARGRRIWRLSEEVDPRSLRFDGAIPLDRGTRVRVRLRLPGGVVVELGGIVADEHGIDLDEAQPGRGAIEAYVDEESEP